jgi:hypothetical protein
MNTLELLRCIKSDSKLDSLCLGVFAVDKLPKLKAFPCCLIQNLDTSKQKGSHWTATYIDHERYGFYFDSYGNCPSKVVERYLRKNCFDFMHNGKRVQGLYSSSCGQHCLYCLFHKANGKSFEEIIDSYASDLDENDNMVTEFVNSNFNMNTVSVEPAYVLQQISKALDQC